MGKVSYGKSGLWEKLTMGKVVRLQFPTGKTVGWCVVAYGKREAVWENTQPGL